MFSCRDNTDKRECFSVKSELRSGLFTGSVEARLRTTLNDVATLDTRAVACGFLEAMLGGSIHEPLQEGGELCGA